VVPRIDHGQVVDVAPALFSSATVVHVTTCSRLNLALSVVLGMLVAAAPAAAQRESEAASAEARAFFAIEEERWCDATAAFLEADSIAPSVDLVLNAAQAAKRANDRRQALTLFKDVKTRSPKSKSGKTAAKAITALEKEIGDSGEGAPCISLTPPPPPPPPPPPTEPPPSNEPTEPVVEVRPLNVPAIATTGAGSVLLVAGVGAAVVGLQPFFAHAAAAEQIRAAETAGEPAASVVAQQKTQNDARIAWSTWAQPTAIAGAVAAGVGVAVVVGGVVWLVGGGP
jgi:hypothetical protein